MSQVMKIEPCVSHMDAVELKNQLRKDGYKVFVYWGRQVSGRYCEVVHELCAMQLGVNPEDYPYMVVWYEEEDPYGSLEESEGTL